VETHIHRRRCDQPSRAGSAGFTLLELMVVVIMIAVLVVLAVPSFARVMRDRRTSQAAHEVAMLFRGARARAMGRGTAVLVRFGATAGAVEVREAQNIDTGNCLSLPASSCLTSVWTAGNAGNRVVGSFDPSINAVFSNVALHFLQSDGTESATADVCFTPLGRPYRRLAANGTFAPMTDVPYIEARPVDGIGLTRRVLVLPTGSSRLAL
jgi:type IV fimbrial biogenesis protein FimT